MKKSILLLCLISLSACSIIKILKTENTALVALTASTSYLGGTGKGMIITMRNIETGEEFTAKKLSHFSSHSVVQNVKPGKYQVNKIILDTGNNKFSNWSESVREHFGIIELEGNKKYYLGTFKGKVKLLKNEISIRLKGLEVPEKLVSTLKEQGEGWGNGEFEKITIVSKEELIIF